VVSRRAVLERMMSFLKFFLIIFKRKLKAKILNDFLMASSVWLVMFQQTMSDKLGQKN
jgi:hypothetical protein